MLPDVTAPATYGLPKIDYDTVVDPTKEIAAAEYEALAVDVSGMSYVHLDFWSATSSLLNVYLISPGPVEKAYSLTVPTSGWTSLDIPLSSFSPVDLADVIQLKFDGNGDIYLDNILFHK